MTFPGNHAACRGGVLLGLVLLCGGCEVEAEGGGDRVQWQLSSQLRDPEERPDPYVELVYMGDDATVSIRP